ncbi:MAG TPA: glycosyltransferase 87 family protein, partial [Chloroflexota bacterium]|nr:glycosyltransferase 87 family protein [Chloroflexota bacterium]
LHVALRTMLPTSDWDAVTYHLAAPKIYLGQHMIVPLPDLPLAMAPSDEEMVLMSGLAAGTDGLGKVLMVAFTLLLGLATYGLARRLCHAAAGWIAVLALFSMVWLVGVMPLTLTDGAGSFLLVVGVIDLVAWAEGRERSRERRSDQLSGSDEPPGSASILLAPVDASGGRSGRWAWLPWGAVRSFLALTRQCEQDARAPRRGLRAERTYGGEPDTRVRVSRVPRRSLHAGSTTGTSETLALPGVPGQYRRLIRAGLLVGLAGAVKMTNLPAIPALVGSAGMLCLLAPGAPIGRRLWAAIVVGFISGSVAMAAVGIWLLKSWYFFGNPLYPNSLQVSGPTQGGGSGPVSPSVAAHVHWMLDTLNDFLIHHVGLIALALVFTPLLWRRSGTRALSIFLIVAQVLWLLYVPYFGLPRYYLGLAALILALAVPVIY